MWRHKYIICVCVPLQVQCILWCCAEPDSVASLLVSSDNLRISFIMDQDVSNLLTEWGLPQYVEIFKENAITSMTMALLGAPEIKELIPIIGHRTLFTRHLDEWRKSMHPEATSTPVYDAEVSLTQLADLSFPISQILSTEPQPSTSASCAVLHPTPITITLPGESIETENDLQVLLEGTLEGKGLLGADRAAPLANVARIRLVRLICTHILKNNPERNITSEIYARWAHEIVHIFPQEQRSVYFYIKFVETIRGISRRLGGKLPDQIHNLKRKYRDTGIIVKRRRSPSISPASTGPSSAKSPSLSHLPHFEIENEEIDQENLQWLNNSSDPWSLVEQKWKSTTNARLNKYKNISISEYFKEFPALQKPLGYKLLEQDFDSVYPDSSAGLAENFPPLKNKIFDVAKKRLASSKDQYAQHLLGLDTASEEISNIACFLLVPSLLAVSTVRLKNSNKKVWRPSKSEVRDGFVTHVQSDAELREVLHLRRKKFSELRLTIQPSIFIVGPSLDQITSHFVIVNDTFYIVPSIFYAVNACFKIIWVVNAEYPAECRCTWTFVQKAFYKIKTHLDADSTTVNTLLGELGICN